MRAVDVGVRQQDRLAVAELLRIEVLADPGAEGGDDRPDLLVAQHLVGAGLLDVQDLSAERQDRLEPAVAAVLRRAAGRVPLDDDELRLLGIALLAVRELARQREAIERALPEHEVTGLAGGLTRAERGEALLDDPSRVARVLLKVLPEGVVDR